MKAPAEFWILAFGLSGQMIFSLRFFVQWICSERKKISYVPRVFWYLSILGSIVLLIYAIYRKDPVFILGQSTGIVIYVRNLMLIAEQRKASQAVVLEQGESL